MAFPTSGRETARNFPDHNNEEGGYGDCVCGSETARDPDHLNKDALMFVVVGWRRMVGNPSVLLLEARLTCSNDHSWEIKNAPGPSIIFIPCR